jgi:hypothetical protein
LPNNQTGNISFISLEGSQCSARPFLLNRLLILAGLCLCTAQLAPGQDNASLTETNSLAGVFSAPQTRPPAVVDLPARAPDVTETPGAPEPAAFPPGDAAIKVSAPARVQVESDLVFEGLASYGHYKIFASGSGTKLYIAGVEYDRHSWGRLLKARMDYVAEFLPVVLLYAPVTQDIWGTPTSPDKHIVPGIGFSPIGFRMLWRDKKAIKPYLMAKGGVLGFTQKALSQKATYENFSLQSATGVNVRMNERWDLRLGVFSDFHFSNAFIVPVNPGLDVMNANLGLVYNFAAKKP